MRWMENRYQFNAHCYLGQFTTMGLFLSKKLNLVSEVVISIEQIGNLVWTMVIPTLITQSGSEQENRDHCLCNRVLTLLSLTSQQNIIQMGPILADPQALCLYFAVSTSHQWGSERGTELLPSLSLSHYPIDVESPNGQLDVSISDKMSYCKISWSLKAVRLAV